jgi:hypothetical protein
MEELSTVKIQEHLHDTSPHTTEGSQRKGARVER